MNTGYMATIFDHGRLVEQLTILPMGDKLEINDCAGTKPVYLFHDPERLTVFIGRYGRFSRDHDWNNLGEQFDINNLFAEVEIEVSLEDCKPGRKK